MSIRREPYQRKPTGRGPIRNIEKIQWSLVMLIAFGTMGYAMYQELGKDAPPPPPPPPPQHAAHGKPPVHSPGTSSGGSVSAAELEQLRQSIQRSADVRKDADPTVNATSRRPPIVQAAITCDPSELKTLLDQGSDINTADSSGETALMWAVKRGCVESVRLLLSRGANANLTTRAGVSALALARKSQNVEVNRLLEDWGAKASPSPVPQG